MKSEKETRVLFCADGSPYKTIQIETEHEAAVRQMWAKYNQEAAERQKALDAEWAARAQWWCAECRNTGWKIVEKNGRSGAARCSCMPGGLVPRGGVA